MLIIMTENIIDLKEFTANRSMIKDAFSNDAEEVEIAGWIHDSRALGKIKFIVLRDATAKIQVVGFKGDVSDEIFDIMDKISRESVVYMKGKLVASKQAPGGKELIPSEIKIIAKADDLPIDVTDFSKTELPKRLDYRFLDLHRSKVQAVFKIESTIMQGFREFMVKEKGATEFVFPSLIGSSSEGGTEMFTMKYFGKDAYLSQSCQLYKQMVTCAMEKAFSIFTVWRAEKHSTVKHLNEARQLDYEQAFADEFVVMDVMAKTTQYIIKKVLDERADELAELEITDLVVPEVKYMTFAQAKAEIEATGVNMEEFDLTTEAEKKLGELYPDTLVMVHDWPYEGRGFYIMPKDGDTLKGTSGKEKTTRGFDCIYRGMEITSGGQRVHIPELLIEQLKEKGLNPDKFKSYIDSFRFGSPPHGGFGIGLERLTMLILNVKNIREVTLFPRDKERLTP